MRRVIFVHLTALLAALSAQTTLGVISGRVRSAILNSGIAGVRVICENESKGTSSVAFTDARGDYALPLLPPGVYRIRAEAGGVYRAAEIHDLELPVAGFVLQDVPLRLLTDLWQTGKFYSASARGGNWTVMFYGPDVDITRSVAVEQAGTVRGNLEPTLSYVIEERRLRELPLIGRDVYAALVFLPGVTNDTATVRGLGFSVNGQRPSSSNFILDGLENNNYLISGPLTTVAPETVQEYRVSTNNFSAEYGRTAGFLANSVTKSGSREWHGTGYSNLRAHFLNANGFARNLEPDEPRRPMHEYQAGVRVGGPIRKERWFDSTAFEFLASRNSADAATYLLPTPAGLSHVPANTFAARILASFPPPLAQGSGDAVNQPFHPPVMVNRVSAVERVDRVSRDGADHLFGRASVFGYGRPDFIWSPYRDMSSALDQNAGSYALGHTRNWTPSVITEIRAGFGVDRLEWNRPHPEIPVILTPIGTLGSPVNYTFRGDGKTGELAGNLVKSASRHLIKLGGGYLERRYGDDITLPGAGYTIRYADLDFLKPAEITVPLQRRLRPGDPDTVRDSRRDYRYRQWSAFSQDSFRMTPRLVLHFGLRYDYFGPPINTGATKDRLVQLGPGNSFPERIAAATLAPPGRGNQRIYDADHKNVAPRAGFAWNIEPSGTTILRGSYGIFYDRTFDNLWLNAQLNDAVRATVNMRDSNPLTGFDPLAPLAASLPLLQVGGPLSASEFNSVNLTFFQPRLRTPYTQSFFAAFQHRFGQRWLVEADYAGSIGRELLTTDVVNRSRGFNPTLPDLEYRANQGASNYHAFIATMQFHSRRLQARASYTLSHAIDNQSEPLGGYATNLGIAAPSGRATSPRPSAFTVQFDSRADRANADFDQRQNVVFDAIWDAPAPAGTRRWAALLRDWKIAAVGAFRSGSPYDVLTAFPRAKDILNNRASLILPEQLQVGTGPIAGGRTLLNEAAFADPGSQLGNLGRNALMGPGAYNVDLSLSRSFAAPRLREGARVVLRADAYNFLNHANLGKPDLVAASCCNTGPLFSAAFYGRRGRGSGLPVFAPFNETPRQVQLMLRIEF